MGKNRDNLKNGNYIIENKEKLLYKRKNKRKIKRLFFLSIIMISTLVTLCLKLPYFNITTIEILGNKNASKAEINNVAKTELGSNIFYSSFTESKKQIIKNPYILGATFKKVLPNKIIINIEERVAVFYGKVNNTYYILDNKGVLLQKRSDIKDMDLVNLIGFDYEKCGVGNLIVSEDNRKINIANDITNIIKEYKITKGATKITMVDVSNVLDVKVYAGEMCIKFGTTEDLKNKFNKAINIISEPAYKSAKGYVDVSFTGNPVVFIEHKK
ncbi:FtsQ-type POTRA domain-containing protein [Clostridium bowmanii]|uniref:cell division protein FtsQ/DivIB n=1 Tax=Clostridium bowmanii TaxID=132925 RepID=UPI001C0B51D9|nr:FtsQ-type POTRA domain-containing protein [Clostridium bowmanii]MBU3190546.1 FtsQ-type POTRA domain-containing protein [Clostridium bowmanii]MCA1075077.1 FtsQ-type POTRA domain-containing protein [Clostridium bowmanii]